MKKLILILLFITSLSYSQSLLTASPATTFGGILHFNGNSGLSTTLQTIYDGLGNVSALQLSTTGINVNGTIYLNGTAFAGNDFHDSSGYLVTNTYGEGLKISGRKIYTDSISSGDITSSGTVVAYFGDELGWRNFNTYYYNDGTITHYYWNRLFQIPSGGTGGSISFQVIIKNDYNYAGQGLYNISISSYGGSSVSVIVDRVSGTSFSNSSTNPSIKVAVDSSGFVWVITYTTWQSFAKYKIIANDGFTVLSSITYQEANPSTFITGISQYNTATFPGLVIDSALSGFSDIYRAISGNILIYSNYDNSNGILQTNGNVVPSITNSYSLGTSSYIWTNLYSQTLTPTSMTTGYFPYKTSGALSNTSPIYTDGTNVGIGTVTPNSKLAVVGLPVYANNAAAITGGLAAGDFYRTGGDPDLVCVVH